MLHKESRCHEYVVQTRSSIACKVEICAIFFSVIEVTEIHAYRGHLQSVGAAVLQWLARSSDGLVVVGLTSHVGRFDK